MGRDKGSDPSSLRELGSSRYRSTVLNCAIRAGAGTATKFHGVGDGAQWIAEQVELRFGLQARYLVDLYHVCEYLAPAGERIAGKEKQTWMNQQKQKMKENRSSEVPHDLQPFLEDDTVADSDAPVRACRRYIRNRPGQFDDGRILRQCPETSSTLRARTTERRSR